MLCTNKGSREFAEVRLVTDQRHAPALDAFGQLGQHTSGFMPGRQLVQDLNRRAIAKAG